MNTVCPLSGNNFGKMNTIQRNPQPLISSYCDRPTIIPTHVYKGKSVPLQAWTGPEGSRKLGFPDFVTTAQHCGRLSALRTGRLYP